MAMLPLMPSGGSPIETPSPGQPPPVGGAPAGPEMMGMMGPAAGGGVPPMAGSTDPNMMSSIVMSALQQFDQIQQMIMDLAMAFPGNEVAARQMMDGLEQWRQAIVVSMSAPPAMMPGAPQMM